MKPNLEKLSAIKVMKWKTKVYAAIFLLTVFMLFCIFMLFVMVSSDTGKDMVRDQLEQEEPEVSAGGAYIASGIAPEVTRYETHFEKYAKEYGIEEPINYIS